MTCQRPLAKESMNGNHILARADKQAPKTTTDLSAKLVANKCRLPQTSAQSGEPKFEPKMLILKVVEGGLVLDEALKVM